VRWFVRHHLPAIDVSVRHLPHRLLRDVAFDSKLGRNLQGGQPVSVLAQQRADLQMV
jgi:hypothetical protein